MQDATREGEVDECHGEGDATQIAPVQPIGDAHADVAGRSADGLYMVAAGPVHGICAATHRDGMSVPGSRHSDAGTANASSFKASPETCDRPGCEGAANTVDGYGAQQVLGSWNLVTHGKRQWQASQSGSMSGLISVRPGTKRILWFLKPIGCRIFDT